MDINWISLSIEALFSTLLEGIAFALIAYWVFLKGRRALREGRLDDSVVFSFNFIDTSGETPVLAFRTPISGTMREIFQSEPLIRAIKEAAHGASMDDPIVRLPDPAQHRMMQRLMINFCNRLNTEGQVRLLAGEPCEEHALRLALVFEPGAENKLFRIVPVSDPFWTSLDLHRETLTFGLSYHRGRLGALEAIRSQERLDEQGASTERVLAPFRLAVPPR